MPRRKQSQNLFASSCYGLLKSILRKILSTVFRFLPLKNDRIVFDNFNGRGFGCNPKYIALALRESGFELAWLATDASSSLPSYVKAVKYDSVSAWLYLATAKVFITNVRNSKGVKKRPGQKYIQTWHASLGPKMIEKDAEQSLSLSYLSQAKANGRDTDLMFADNAVMAQVYKSSFWYEGEVVRCGVPRNQDLIEGNEGIRIAVRDQLNLPKDSLVCLYAPTWRSEGMDVPLFDFSKCLSLLEERFNRPAVLCLRFHPNTSFSNCFTHPKVYDVSSYSDSQELLAAIDVLISDYSSIVEDFTFTSKPAFMYVPDYDEYLHDRQFYYPLTDRPYPLCKSEDELWGAISSYSDEGLESALSEFREKFDIVDDGHGAERIARIVTSWALGAN